MAPRKRRSQPRGHPPPDRTQGISNENLPQLSLSTDGSTNVPSVGQSVTNSIQPNTGTNSE